jgi:hypothetical protein
MTQRLSRLCVRCAPPRYTSSRYTPAIYTPARRTYVAISDFQIWALVTGFRRTSQTPHQLLDPTLHDSNSSFRAANSWRFGGRGWCPRKMLIPQGSISGIDVPSPQTTDQYSLCCAALIKVLTNTASAPLDVLRNSSGTPFSTTTQPQHQLRAWLSCSMGAKLPERCKLCLLHASSTTSLSPI